MTNFYLNEKGVWYQPKPTKKSGDTPSAIWICSPLEIVAITRDHNNENHGRLLQFLDAECKEHTWSMPMEYLAGEGLEYRKILLSMGLRITTDRNNRNLLSYYIQEANPQKKVRCINKLGWYEGQYVLPNETIGNNNEEELVFQGFHYSPKAYGIAGALGDWQQKVSVYCVDNSRLSFAASLGFAAPLLHIMEEEGGGYNFRGKSSGGKTTVLKVAASIYGGKDRICTWRGTSNGLEAIAFMHNDCLLCLDELGQSDPKDAGNIAYLLVNGGGKLRANKSGGAKDKLSWRLNFLSSGEIGLGDHMREGGKKVRAGQEIRVVDIPANAGDYDVFQHVHGFEGGAEFSRMLSLNTAEYYGVAGRVFLQIVARDIPYVKERIKNLMKEFIDQNIPSNADGQVLRVLHKIALIAAAGELATAFGITQWPEKEAFWGASECFNAWIKSRGGVSAQETKAILTQVRQFFELHGESRLSPWDQEDRFKTSNRVGFRKEEGSKLHYFIFQEAFKNEVCTGLDSVLAAKVLLEHEWLMSDAEGKSTRAENLPGFGGKNIRCYRINVEKLFSDMI